MKYLLTHAHLVIDENREYIDGAIAINDQRIEEIYSQASKLNVDENEYKIINLNGSLIMPGFFDTHCHGLSGINYDTCSEEEINMISYENALSGTTSFLCTLSYDVDKDDYKKRLELFKNIKDDYARYVGIHMEGPFVNPKCAGAGNPSKFLSPDIQFAKELIDTSKDIKQMTIAMELDGSKEVADLLKQNNIKVMCGHSLSTLENITENVDGITHLFNAMRPLHHRDMTLVNCAFLNKWQIEIIADGKHIDKNVLALVLKNIDRDKLMLVSDSAPCRNLKDGTYVFLSKECVKKDNAFKTANGNLAGSVASINDEMKVLRSIGAKYSELLAYSSLNAFRFYGLDKQFGTLDKGKYADIVIMDDELNIKNVFVKGRFIYD